MAPRGCIHIVDALCALPSLQPTKLALFLRKIEAGHRESNPYHNATHVADVLQVSRALQECCLQACTVAGVTRLPKKGGPQLVGIMAQM